VAGSGDANGAQDRLQRGGIGEQQEEAAQLLVHVVM
jgi:hypothetical protein